MHLGETDYGLAIAAVRALNRQRTCTFLMPTRFMSAEAALAGSSINERLDGIKVPGEDWRVFFANSHEEALEGAVKLARHFAVLHRFPNRDIWILGVPDSVIFRYGLETFAGMMPGFATIGLSEIRARLTHAAPPPVALVLTRDAAHMIADDADLADLVQNMPGLLIGDWDDAPHDADFMAIYGLGRLRPDVVLFGESLTAGEVPFGAFAMSPKAYEPWNRFATGFLHSSTFGGNRLTLSVALQQMLGAAECARKVAQYSNDERMRVNQYARFVNPALQGLYELIGGDIVPVEATGTRLTFSGQAGPTVRCLDAATGAGAAVRGHCPPDIETAVLDGFDPNTDYWSILERELRNATGLECTFPAVSGASAAETAILLALAATGRRRVITFTSNFSGRTLLALMLSAIDDIQAPFRPLYPDVVYIDPSRPDAAEAFSAAATDDTALVWFEYIRGMDGLPVPPALCQAIRNCRERHGYLVGIDEVLTGLFRTGRLASASIAFPDPDLMTLSKALSDGTFPIGVTLASAAVAQSAAERAPRLVEALSRRHRNQLGAAIAANCLRNLLSPALPAHIEMISARLAECLSRIVVSSPWLASVRQTGLLVLLQYDTSHPSLHVSHPEFNEMAVVSAFSERMTRCGLLPYLDQLTPSLTITQSELDEMICSLEAAFMNNTDRIADEVLSKKAKLVALNAS